MTDLYDQLDRGASQLPLPERILTVGAHPDDAEFGAGAVLARWAAGGSHITMCIVTDGSKGSWDPTIEASRLVALREEEQRAAAAVLGARDVVHLGHRDGELEYSADLRHEIAATIRRVRPDVVLTHDPWQKYQLHPDHRVTGFATADAVVSAREPLAMPELGIPAHRPSALLLWSAEEPDHAEPVDEQSAAKKLEALMCHSSQSQTTMGGAATDEDAFDRFRTRLDAWHRTMGAGLDTGPAETFKLLRP